ncbi:unnamed protein product [Meloidogyne enterolobii]|uniref:Uncharacterized protein n=1 Tax=Meloidogyne enterolobii TaxID=390850 RepID=A0ACB0ZFW3_MELEN
MNAQRNKKQNLITNKIKILSIFKILNSPTVDLTTKDQNLINSILPIIEAQKRIMHAFNDLDDIFLHGPILFEEIILSNFNIFRLTEIFSIQFQYRLTN